MILKNSEQPTMNSGAKETYSFSWPGKKDAEQNARDSIGKKFIHLHELDCHGEQSQNLILEGENLDGLKWLKKEYENKIKIIYIDPPYNTGKDFTYTDQFQKYQWLNMMYSRLLAAKELMCEEGIIFVSIGVEELANLKKIMDEVFGEENFIEIFSWVKTSTPPGLSTKSRKTVEYIICFEKKKSSEKYHGMELDGGDHPLINTGNNLQELSFKKESVYFNPKYFPDGKYPAAKTKKAELIEEIEIENGRANKDFRIKGEFKWSQKFLDEEIKKGTQFFIRSKLFSVRFKRKEKGFKRPNNFIAREHYEPVISKSNSDVGTNENAKAELMELLGEDIFDYPKPVSLIKYLIGFNIKQNDLVLDFFAGSGTTAEAVMELNMERNLNLNFILVQSREPFKKHNVLDDSIPFPKKNKSGKGNTELPNDIAALCRMRVELAGEKISGKGKVLSPNHIGFKVYREE